jgi:hypothetical protein
LEFQFLRCYRATTPTLGCFDFFFPVPRIQYRASRLSLNLESSLLPFSCLNPVHCDAKSFALLAKQWEKIWTKQRRWRAGERAREGRRERERQSARERHTHGTSFWRSGTEKPIMGTWTPGKGRRNISKKQVPRLQKPPQKQVPHEKVLGTCKFWRPGVCTREEHR